MIVFYISIANLSFRRQPVTNLINSTVYNFMKPVINSYGSHLEQFGVVVDGSGVVGRGFALFCQHHVKLGFLVGLTTDEHDATVFAGLHQNWDQVSNHQEVAQVVHLYTRNGGS